jgi:hypothetical protein
MTNYDSLLKSLYEDILAQYHHLCSTEHPFDLQIFKNESQAGRKYANMLHDMPNIRTGMASKKAILEKIKNHQWKHSEDHFNSRQRGGEAIVKYIKKCFGAHKEPDFNYIKKIVDKHRQVHIVTKEENHKLSKIMEPGKSPEKAYEEGGVELFEASELFGKRGRRTNEWKAKIRKHYAEILK